VICFACLWLFLCNMGLCSSILSVYLPFIEAQGISDSMGSAILSVRSLFSFQATFAVGAYYRKFSLRRGILLAYGASIAAALVFGGGEISWSIISAGRWAGFALASAASSRCLLMASKWSEAQGLVVDIGTAGASVATMCFPPVASQNYPGIFPATDFCSSGIPDPERQPWSYLLVRDTPEEMGLEAFAGRGGTEGPKTGGCRPRSRWL
jgi:hypothetical protein